jgi:hypothetical protein
VARPPKIQSVAEMKQWYEAGYTYAEMAEMHKRKYHIEIHPTSISSLRRRQGWDGRLLKNHPLIPWTIRPEHQKSYLLNQLRREAKRRMGIQSSQSHSLESIRAWAESLRAHNAVVDYRPNTEEGFFLVYARDGIDIDLIREPD